MSDSLGALAMQSHELPEMPAARWADDNHSVSSSASYPAYYATEPGPSNVQSLPSLRSHHSREQSAHSIASIDESSYLTPLQQAFLAGHRANDHHELDGFIDHQDVRSHERPTTAPVEDLRPFHRDTGSFEHSNADIHHQRPASVPARQREPSARSRAAREASRPYPSHHSSGSVSLTMPHAAKATGTVAASIDGSRAVRRRPSKDRQASTEHLRQTSTREKIQGPDCGEFQANGEQAVVPTDGSSVDRQPQIALRPGETMRALNEDTEHYMWDSITCMLNRIEPSEIGKVRGEVLVFPPGSCGFKRRVSLDCILIPVRIL